MKDYSFIIAVRDQGPAVAAIAAGADHTREAGAQGKTAGIERSGPVSVSYVERKATSRSTAQPGGAAAHRHARQARGAGGLGRSQSPLHRRTGKDLIASVLRAPTSMSEFTL